MENKFEDRIGYLVKRAQQVFRLEFDEALRGEDLNAPQYAVLSLVVDYPGGSAADLARRYCVTAQTMAGIVSGLESKALIEKSPHATHKRVLTIQATALGKTRLERCDGIAAAVEERLMSAFSAADEQEFRRLLLMCARSSACEIAPASLAGSGDE